MCVFIRMCSSVLVLNSDCVNVIGMIVILLVLKFRCWFCVESMLIICMCWLLMCICWLIVGVFLNSLVWIVVLMMVIGVVVFVLFVGRKLFCVICMWWICSYVEVDLIIGILWLWLLKEMRVVFIVSGVMVCMLWWWVSVIVLLSVRLCGVWLRNMWFVILVVLLCLGNMIIRLVFREVN